MLAVSRGSLPHATSAGLPDESRGEVAVEIGGNCSCSKEKNIGIC